MATWTQGQNDLQRLIKVHEMIVGAMEKGMIINILLHNNKFVEGVLAGLNCGNNGADKPISSYYGQVTLKNINNESITIDFMDISVVQNATSDDKLRKYEEKSVIEKIKTGDNDE